MTGLIVVAVADNGNLTRSEDGSTWAPYTLPAAMSATSVAFGGGIWVAVGTGGKVATSPDGITWTARSTPTTNNLNGVSFGNGLWVAVGNAGTVITSWDGIFWTSRSPGGTNIFKSVAYGAGRWMAVGGNSSLSTTVAYGSTDGMTWSNLSISAYAGYMSSVIYVAQFGKFVMPNASAPAAYYSSNGTTVSAVTTPSSFGSLSIVMGKDTFDTDMAIIGVSNDFCTSTDGITWLKRTPGPGIGNTVVGWDGTLLLAGGDSGSLKSTQMPMWPISWGSLNSGFTTGKITSFASVAPPVPADSSAPVSSYVSTNVIVSTATAYSNQRKIDRTSNGVLWAVYQDTPGGGYPLRVTNSVDDGVTWSTPTTIMNGSGSMGATYVSDSSFFIDVDDFAHLVYKDTVNGYIYYRRGTPDAGRTSWTWSAALLIVTGGHDYPDVVAHREGTGWQAHVVFSRHDVVGSQSARYVKVSISSSGTLTGSSTVVLGGNGPYNNTNPTYPSIDFNHTGDGKTVAGGTPHLYVAWSAGAAGSGKGIRFKKATYSAGAWAWGAEREIDSTRDILGGVESWINCLFDGTRVLIGGQIQEGTNLDLMLYQRDDADTVTTTTVLVDNGTAGNQIRRGSMTYDKLGNVYLVGVDSASPAKVVYRKWDRASANLGAIFTLDTRQTQGWVSTKRGFSSNKIEFVYTNGPASPYPVVYGAIPLITWPRVRGVIQGGVEVPATIRGVIVGGSEVAATIRGVMTGGVEA